MLRFLFLVSIYVAAVVSAAAIVGGRAEQHGAQRHTVFMTSSIQDCSGTLIARDLVLTAAHCVANGERYSIRTDAGSVSAARVVMHPSFRRNLYETHKVSPDIALVKLSAPVSGSLRPARLANDKKYPPHGTEFVIAGFGESVEGDRRVGTFRTTQLVNAGTTGNIMLRLEARKGAPASGACVGDSGGSAYRVENNTLVLYGVIAWSAGRSGRSCGLVTGIVLVANQLEWIRATAKQLGSPLD